jgi:hypothetical protein
MAVQARDMVASRELAEGTRRAATCQAETGLSLNKTSSSSSSTTTSSSASASSSALCASAPTAYLQAAEPYTWTP